ncbi:MAG: ATP-binding protein [Bacteroidota bacterium]
MKEPREFNIFIYMRIPQLLYLLIVVYCTSICAQPSTSTKDREAWNQLRKKPLDEQNFRAACDLMQAVGKTNLATSYEMLAEYVPVIKASGNHRWLHILLMGWGKAKESFGDFKEAETLYSEARENASFDPRCYDESLVSTSMMYLEWGKADSLEKYLREGKKSCIAIKDNENLSFLYTFRAMGHLEDTTSMRLNLDTAISLAKDLTDKNALFTAAYNKAVNYSQFNPAKQVSEFEYLYELSKDSTLNRYPVRLYDRTAFTFRNAGPSVYYNLMQINFLLTDYENAWKFAELFYDATIKPNPSSINAPYFNAEMAIAKAYQQDFSKAAEYLATSRNGFKMPEDSISYVSYFIASGMLAEHAGQNDKALHYFSLAVLRGTAQSPHLVPPEIYYASALIRAGKTEEAAGILTRLKDYVQTRRYSAIGLNYYKYTAALLKAKGDYLGYSRNFDIYNDIKDSLTSLNSYRSIQEIETRMRVHDKEQQILRLNFENELKVQQIRMQRIYIGIFAALAAIIIALLLAYSRNLAQRKLQAEQIARQNEILQQHKMEEMEKQHRIDVMQGAIDAEENERYKIADQLHDETGSMLALASLNISSVIEKGTDDLQSGEKIQKAYDIVNDVASTIRDISHRLTPLIIEKYGFRKAIEDLEQTINLSQKIKLETIVIGFEDDNKHPVTLLNNLYRIVQELVHNILKHAGAEHAMIELVEHEDLLALMVEDDGAGIANDAFTKGKGLGSIQSKIAYLKGRMEIMKKNDKGTLIVIEIPVSS